MAEGSPLVVCDFDGTLVDVDVGNALCVRHAHPSWREIIARFERGESSLPAAQREVWALVDVSIEALAEQAVEMARLRDGAEALFAAAARGDCRLVIASGGFGFYVRPLLGARVDVCEAVLHNELRPGPPLETWFPHDELACERCAVCKAKVIERYRHPGAPVIFCGDGTSDHCAVASADSVFAVEGSHLARRCDAQGVRYTPFITFSSVVAVL